MDIRSTKSISFPFNGPSRGFKAVAKELRAAESQLRQYRQALEQKYGEALKLRTYTVVAVDFERLIWEEVIREM